jgi:tRNA uridine 5-carboxymethylaminomethyl modification enzyme
MSIAVFDSGVGGISVLKRPEISLKDLKKYIQKDYSHQVEEQVEIIAKYEGYILKAEKEEKMQELEKISIPKDIDYSKFTNIAKEAREKLDKIKPISIGQAIRISGANPSDISMLMMYLKRGTKDE